ncbi:hypothetical protein WNY37_03975 [Henriciella sp. AS95]|uniref:hypothetical protein n=1 Tax=Henriciella sp. AS95 TaxID=3135782 RepID=UPI003173C449
MPRRLIALLISGISIVFAFGALTAIRWPSIMMFLGLFFHPDPSLGLSNINWRELGFAYGAPYFLAALCFYASSICVASRRKGSIIWYIMGCVSATPSFYLVDFEQGWWRNPSGPEGMVAGGAVMIILLGIAVALLRRRRVGEVVSEDGEEDGSVQLSKEQFEALIARSEARSAPAEETVRPVRRRGPVPAAIARQRAHFAAEGRRMKARRGR